MNHTTLSRRGFVISGCCLALPAHGSVADIAALLAAQANDARRANGLAALNSSRKLTSSALTHANTMLRTGQFSHSAGGTTLTSRVKATGYRYRRVSENIAWLSRRAASEQDLARAFHDMWMKSAGHRKNILDRSVTEIGVGIARAGAKVFAVQVFGRPA